MEIFPEMTAKQFGEVDPGSLILVKVAAQRHAWCLKVVYDPSSDAPQEFVVALAPQEWGEVGKPCLIRIGQYAMTESVLDLGSSFVLRADTDSASIALNPDPNPDGNLGLLVVGDEKYLRVLGLPPGTGRPRPTLWVQLPSGEVNTPALEWLNRPRALVQQWKLIPIVPDQLRTTIQPEPFFTWPVEGCQ